MATKAKRRASRTINPVQRMAGEIAKVVDAITLLSEESTTASQPGENYDPFMDAVIHSCRAFLASTDGRSKRR